MIENIKKIENEIELLKQNNEFNLLINPIRNKKEFYPKLFCLTNFCFPNLNDFRDILENLYDQINYNVVDIIHSIPNFLIK